MKRLIYTLVVLAVGIGIGFAGGVYTLPIIIELRSEQPQEVTLAAAEKSDPIGRFNRDSPGSDPLHWGEGGMRISAGKLIFEDDVKLAPGPDYRIYMSRKFADTKADFAKIKHQAVEVGKLKVFSGPLVFDLPEDFNTNEFDNVIVWCETFSMYIASARLD